MLKKLAYGTLVVLGLLAVAAGIAAYLADRYLRSEGEKLLEEYLPTYGLSVAFRDVDLDLWEHFPVLTVRLDSLHVRDTLSALEPDLLTAGRVRATLRLGKLLDDTIRLENLSIEDGYLYLESDSSGHFNTGTLLDRKDTTATGGQNAGFHLDLNGFEGRLNRFDFTYVHPPTNKRIGGRINELTSTFSRTDDGRQTVDLGLDTHFDGLAFNTEKGAYLSNADVAGDLNVSLRKDHLSIAPTDLRIGEQLFNVSAELDLAKTGPSYIQLANPTTDFALTRAMLHDSLRAKLADYFVEGEFPVRAVIETSLERGVDPRIDIDVTLSGHRVKLRQYWFGDVALRGHVVNRLDPELGGVPGSKKNLRIDFNDLTARYLGARIRSPGGIVAAFRKDARLIAPMYISGTAATVSQYLENENFLFREGRFELATRINASLLDFEEMVTTSDGTLTLNELLVDYAPAEARFPFRRIEVSKRGEDVGFDVHSSPLPSGFTFRLEGRVDNLVPLLLERPGQTLTTDVRLSAPRIDWTDFLALFGEEGYLDGEALSAGGGSDLDRKTSMKKTLLGLRNAFHPSIEAVFDTVAYFDVFELTDFNTGLHFERDTLILERSAFDWAGSTIAFGARLGLSTPRETPFAITASADNLNLNHLRPSLNYFGLQLPRELDTLPADLGINFSHRGVLDDTIGIKAGTNAGKLVFNDGSEDLFAGSLAYAPGPAGLQSWLRLGGDPRIVNKLFGAENFFFGSGRFDIDLTVSGTPETLPELLNNGELSLRIDSSRINYRPAGVDIPIRHFAVNVAQEFTNFYIHLLTETDGRSVELKGDMDRLSAFLYPREGETFSITAEATAKSLRWSDVSEFMQPSATSGVDTAAAEAGNPFSATGGIFDAFRPELSVRIDTFWFSERTPLIDVHTGLHIRDSTQLVLESSGFRFGDGNIDFEAEYALDEREQSPFLLRWDVTDLDLEELVHEITASKLVDEAKLGLAAGRVTSSGRLSGLIDETSQQLLFDSSEAWVDYDISDLELADWPQLEDVGRKALMKKRLRHLRFHPIVGRARWEGERLVFSRSEIQSTGFQLFVEGQYDPVTGPDLLISIPLSNVWRGVMDAPPDTTGYANSGWKVYLVAEPGENGKPKTSFRLGRRKYYKARGLLDRFRLEKKSLREARRTAKRK